MKWFYIFLVSAYLLVNGVLYFTYAQGQYRGSADTARYTEGVSLLEEGKEWHGKMPSYKGYIAYLYVIKKVFGPEYYKQASVVGVMLLGLAGVLFFFYVGQESMGRWIAGLAGFSIFLYPDFWNYNFHVQTDGLYAWWLLISVCLTYVVINKSAWWWIFLGPALGYLALIRPNGMVSAPVLFVLAIILQTGWRYWLRFGVLGGAALLLGVFSYQDSLGTRIEKEDPSDQLSKGMVIWNHHPWHFKMPEAALEAESPMGRFVEYVLDHPMESSGVIVSRLFLTLVPLRDVFSPLHNLGIALFAILFYPFVLVGLFHQSMNRFLFICLLMLAVHLGIVALTFAISDGRWLMYFYVYITPFFGIGVIRCFQWLSKLTSKKPHAG